MRDSSPPTHLYLNGKHVGTVTMRERDHVHDPGWSFGDFHPADLFAEFAPLFGQWSLLMHAEDDNDRLSTAAAEELRRTELAIDSVRARLYLPATDQWQEVSQLNIDGTLIEWKIV